LTSLTNHLFGVTFSGWVASGDATADNPHNPHSNSANADDERTPLLVDANAKSTDGSEPSSAGAARMYTRMRVLCAVWVYGTGIALAAGVGLQVARGYRWYEFVPALACAGYEVWRTWAFVWWV
jgi:hypothetical protein